jgi:hypothetical protein
LVKKDTTFLTISFKISYFHNKSEILRVIDSLQLCSKYKVATPVDWKNGDACMITPGVTEEECKTLFPKGYKVVNVPSEKAYIRLTPQP